MSKKTTTRIVYNRGNSMGNQYAPQNCSGYGTKWRVAVDTEKQRIIGFPKLLDCNITISAKIEKKIEESNNNLNILLGY
jgi:hypothetical protein